MSPRPPAAPPSDREERILIIIETARAKRPKFRDPRITMAHGAGLGHRHTTSRSRAKRP